jgi:hypothetical protein
MLAMKDLMMERDQLIAERDQLIAERDQLIAERDQLIAERDQLLYYLRLPEARLGRFLRRVGNRLLNKVTRQP